MTHPKCPACGHELGNHFFDLYGVLRCETRTCRERQARETGIGGKAWHLITGAICRAHLVKGNGL